jgi:hypothetical protein
MVYADALRFTLENLDKGRADDLALFLGIADPTQGVEEIVAGVREV